MSHQPNNIFAGTQVVSLVEVRGTNNSLLHPRGAVGVVTRTPTGDQTQFLVRFPDGFEASLTRGFICLKPSTNGFWVTPSDEFSNHGRRGIEADRPPML